MITWASTNINFDREWFRHGLKIILDKTALSYTPDQIFKCVEAGNLSPFIFFSEKTDKHIGFILVSIDVDYINGVRSLDIAFSWFDTTDYLGSILKPLEDASVALAKHYKCSRISFSSSRTAWSRIAEGFNWKDRWNVENFVYGFDLKRAI